MTVDSRWPRVALDALFDEVRQVSGRDLSQFEELFLAKSLDRRLAATSTETPTAYVDCVKRDSAEVEALLHSLDIHYSEFFRDPLVFALLEQRILPGLAERVQASGRTVLRVWSAGCAAGQEALSVAILLSELSDGRKQPTSFRIFATDSSEDELAQARGGVFPEAAMRNVRLSHLQRWFSRQGQAYVTAPELRERVDFSPYDLLDESTSCPPGSIFGEFDLVLCCNVLFYYRPESRRMILDKIRSCLAPNGYLVTGDSERETLQGAGFRSVFPAVSVFQRVR